MLCLPCFCIAVIACLPVTTSALPTMSFSLFQVPSQSASQPEQAGQPEGAAQPEAAVQPESLVGVRLPTNEASSRQSKTAEIGSQLDDLNITLSGLPSTIDKLPNCACSVDTNAELDAVSAAVADIDEKCSALEETITALEFELPDLTGKIASAFSNADYQQMKSDIDAITEDLEGFLTAMTAVSTSAHSVYAVNAHMEGMRAIESKLATRDASIATCSDTCSGLSPAAALDPLRTEMEALQSEDVPGLYSGLQESIDENIDLATTRLAISMDNTAEGQLESVADKLGEVPSIVTETSNALDTFANEAAVVDLRTAVSETTLVDESTDSQQAYEDFKATADALNNTIVTQTAGVRTTDEMIGLLTGLSSYTTDVIDMHSELEGVVSAMSEEFAVLETDIAIATQTAQSVPATLQTYADVVAAAENLPDEGEKKSSLIAKEDRWHVIKEGFQNSECPVHFVSVESPKMCFHLIKQGHDQTQSAGLCRAVGGASGRLITLTEERRVFLFDYMTDHNIIYYYWVGLKNINADYVWTDGSVDDGSVSWGGYPGSECVEMATDGKLASGSCSYADYAICEIPIA